MQRQIVYLMSGAAHLHYLVPSLFTLREHCKEHVTVYAYPESYDYVKRIAADVRLGIEAKLYEPPVRYKKNDQFINKIKLMMSLQSEIAVYIDADTTFHGDIEYLFNVGDQYGFAATQFCHWLSTGSVIRARLQRLRDYPKINKEALETIIKNPHPSPNGGIFSCNPSSPVLPLWLEWTLEAKDVFIADEAVLHVLQAHVPQSEFHVVLGGAYNCSHKYQGSLPEDQVHIHHYHGDSNVRPDKSPRAYAAWWPIYQQCIDRNMGNMVEWYKNVRNKWLDKLLEVKHD